MLQLMAAINLCLRHLAVHKNDAENRNRIEIEGQGQGL